MTQAVVADLETEPELQPLTEDLDGFVVDLNLPEEFEMEVDAVDRLNLITGYNRLDLALRAAKGTAQQERRVEELTRDKGYSYGQLQRLDWKWDTRGKLSTFRKLMRTIAKAQAKQTVTRRDDFLKTDS